MKNGGQAASCWLLENRGRSLDCWYLIVILLPQAGPLRPWKPSVLGSIALGEKIVLAEEERVSRQTMEQWFHSHPNPEVQFFKFTCWSNPVKEQKFPEGDLRICWGEKLLVVEILQVQVLGTEAELGDNLYIPVQYRLVLAVVRGAQKGSAPYN